MTERELASMIIEEVIEYKLKRYRKADDAAYTALVEEISKLSIKTKDILAEIPKDKACMINEYIEKTSALADKDCAYLYEQGARDCVNALKHLGVI